jgi:hypothetical protein
VTGLRIVPITQKDAARFVAAWHRHLNPPAGSVFQVGASDHDGVLRGVAMAGRPVSRWYDNGTTLEVNRVATDGTPHVPSMLYGACWRAARALGWCRLITYTQAGEPGTSLRAAGWRIVGERPAHGGWDRPSRPRTDRGSAGMPRTLWEAS